MTTAQAAGAHIRDAAAASQLVEGSGLTVSASAMVIAIGYSADPEFAGDIEVETGRWRPIRVDPRTGQTSQPYIFAGGDVVRGADLVVTAIADGKPRGDVDPHVPARPRAGLRRLGGEARVIVAHDDDAMPGAARERACL